MVESRRRCANRPACESGAARAAAENIATAANARLAANLRIFGNYYVRSASFPLMPRVLVVDDEPAVRRALERALKLDSYEVELAADGEEALDRLVQSEIDAVILDIAMPRLDGLEVYVGNLRRKTEEDGGSRLIQTIRGVGYVLREE